MSAEDTKPGALPVESAANEIDDAKKQEGSLDVVPAASTKDNEDGKSTSTETVSATVEKTASAQSDEATKLSDSELEDKVIQDAVKQSKLTWPVHQFV